MAMPEISAKPPPSMNRVAKQHRKRDEARELRREAERIQAEIERELRSNRDLPIRIRTNRL